MSDGTCLRFEGLRADGDPAGAGARRWREHLAGCADCRRQAAADALLRDALSAAPPPPGLSAGFEGRLRRRLEERRPARRPAGRPGRLRPAAVWLLAAYGTAAATAALVILARLPWPSLAPSPVAAAVLGALALASPLVLLDRIGIVRPPG